MPRLRVPASVALLALAVLPGRALAADVTLTFDDLANGTVLTTQQIDLPGQPAGSERGIEWGVAAFSPTGQFRYNPSVYTPPDIAPASGANVLNPGFVGGCPPRSAVRPPAARPRGPRPRVVEPSICTWHLTGRFPLAKQHVSVRIGVPTGQPAAAFVLRLLDVNGDLIGADVETAQPGSMGTTLDVSLAGRTAVWMAVESQRGDQGPFFYVDDVTVDAPVDPPPADFGMKVGAGGTPQLDLIPGQSATVPITLTRVNRSAGPVALSIDGLPAGVTASFAPQTLTGRAGVSSVLTLRAASTASDISLRYLTVRATPGDASAGAAARAGNVRLSVETLKVYDAQITGMEVTQATQYPAIPTPNALDPAAPVPYTGVQLVAGRRTVVRVFANNARAVPLGGLPADVILRGYGKDGKELPGSPLYPTSGPDGLLPNNGGLDVTDAIRRGNQQAYTFVLPDAAGGSSGRGVWPANVSRLRAEIIGPGDSPSFFRQTVVECSEPRCRANNAFTVTGIAWATMPILSIWPIQVTGPQQGPPPTPWEVFDAVQTVTPMTVSVPYSYKVTISDERLDYADRDELQDELFDRIEDWYDDFYLDGYLPVATGRAVTGVTTGGATFDPNGNDQPIAIVRGTLLRPLTSVSHEIAHALGRPHAGQNCPGTAAGDDQEGEPWLPDDMGFLQGYGMNTYAVAYPTPPAIIATTSTRNAFDLMSYCAPNNPETGVWVSPRGWDSIVSRYRTGALPLRAVPAAGPATPTLHVAAVVGASGWRIAFVRPGPARELKGTVTAFRAVARNAANVPVAQTVLFGRATGDGASQSLILRGDLPQLDGIASVQIVDPLNTVYATMARTASKPAVRITAPRAGARVRTGKALVVRWVATDADGDRLRATIDYSTDDGRTWRPLGLAPSTGSFTLAPRLLAGATQARVRVRVRDTLDEVAAVSGRIRVDGAPPVARIRAPRTGTSVPADAFLNATGEAYDDAGTALGRASLRWFANGRLVGRGTAVSLRGLPAGRVTLRLVGRDRRVGSARPRSA